MIYRVTLRLRAEKTPRRHVTEDRAEAELTYGELRARVQAGNGYTGSVSLAAADAPDKLFWLLQRHETGQEVQP